MRSSGETASRGEGPAGAPAPATGRGSDGAEPVRIDELTIADEPARWAAYGFDVDGGRCEIAGVSVRLAGEAAGRGIAGWSLRGLRAAELDGLPTSISQAPPRAAAGAHPNGVVAIDHLVAMSPDLDRTVARLERAGLDLRRIREQPTPAGAPRQAFFRLGGEILEVIQEPPQAVLRGAGPDGPARFWGLALLTADIERTARAFDGHAGAIREAVQPERMICTIARSAGLAVPLALMTPPPAGRRAA